LSHHFPLGPIFSPFTNTNYRSAAEKPSLKKIIAGSGSDEKTLVAPLSALKKSAVLNEWIEESTPPNLEKDGAFWFPECDPEVVHTAIEYLKSIPDGHFAIPDRSAGGSEKVLFYVKLYKFALCLG
jgi:hypothetical protein